MARGTSGNVPVKIIAVALVVVLVAGVGVFAMKGHGKKKGGEKNEPTEQLALGEFVVNLADPGETRYLKANIVLAVTGDAPAKGEGEGSGPSPAVRDAVIEVMSSKQFAQLMKPGGKKKLKADIMAAVNKRLEGCKAVDVYFSEFAMQ